MTDLHSKQRDSGSGQKALEGHYEALFENLRKDFRSASLTRLIAASIPAGASVLDIGCGAGLLTAALLRKGCDVSSLDISAEMLALCNRYLAREGLQGRVRKGAVADIAEDGRFDRVVALDVLEHIQDDQQALRRLRGALKKDGALVLAVPALSWLYGPKDEQIGHFRRYDKERLIALLKICGFRVETVRFWNAIGVLPVWFTARLRRKRLNEDFRYAGRSVLKEAINRGLRAWFFYVENRISCRLGLTLIVTARPS